VIFIITFFLTLGSAGSVFTQVQGGEDQKLLQEAKLLVFDKNWPEAEKKLASLINDYPGSEYYAQALFYLGKCQAEQSGKEKEALNSFQAFLKRPDQPQGLVEEAEIAIIDLAFKLSTRARRSTAGYSRTGCPALTGLSSIMRP